MRNATGWLGVWRVNGWCVAGTHLTHLIPQIWSDQSTHHLTILILSSLIRTLTLEEDSHFPLSVLYLLCSGHQVLEFLMLTFAQWAIKQVVSTGTLTDWQFGCQRSPVYIKCLNIMYQYKYCISMKIEELYQLSIFWSGKHEQTSCEQLSGVQDGGPSPVSGHMMERAQPCKKYVRNLLKIFANVYTEVWGNLSCVLSRVCGW